MRTSCNGCRVLRKGCSDDCVIRPCLLWIKSPDAQANATVFLAKFYGRAGLLNLLNAGPENLRPAIFQSLLYEACGRVVDPVYGSVGLLYSGQWHHCQVAVESVLKGLPVMQLPPTSPDGLSSNAGPSQHQMITTLPPFKLYDIRHMSSSKDFAAAAALAAPDNGRTRTRLRRTPRVPVADSEQVSFSEEDDHENYSMFSAEATTEGSVAGQVGEIDVGLELTLGCKYNG